MARLRREKVIKSTLGKVKLAKLSAYHLDSVYADLSGRGLKPLSVRRVHAVMSVALPRVSVAMKKSPRVANRKSPRVAIEKSSAPGV